MDRSLCGRCEQDDIIPVPGSAAWIVGVGNIDWRTAANGNALEFSAGEVTDRLPIERPEGERSRISALQAVTGAIRQATNPDQPAPTFVGCNECQESAVWGQDWIACCVPGKEVAGVLRRQQVSLK